VSIVKCSLTQEHHPFGDLHVTGVEDTQYDSATQVQFDGPSSLDTGTLVSRSTASTYDEPNQSPIKAEPQRGVCTPSANRLSISYAAGIKCLVINAEIMEKFKILRSDGWAEISLQVEKDDANELNGIIVGSLAFSSSHPVACLLPQICMALSLPPSPAPIPQPRGPITRGTAALHPLVPTVLSTEIPCDTTLLHHPLVPLGVSRCVVTRLAMPRLTAVSHIFVPSPPKLISPPFLLGSKGSDSDEDKGVNIAESIVYTRKEATRRQHIEAEQRRRGQCWMAEQ
jgi:hypothetical protein